MMLNREKRVAILISGSGTTMESVVKAWRQGLIPGIAMIRVISSKSSASGIEKAHRLGLPTTTVIKRLDDSVDQFASDLLQALRVDKIDAIFQCGWLPLTPDAVITAYQGQLANQHPGPLDPGRGNDVGGKGMYGERVTYAWLAYLWMTGGPWFTESTVHAVTSQFDEGELLSVKRLELQGMPTTLLLPEDLENKSVIQQLMEMTSRVQSQLLPLEHLNVIGVVQAYGATGKLPTSCRRDKPLVPDENIYFLNLAKQAATQAFTKNGHL